MKKAIVVWGGWDGHEPRQCAEIFAPVLEKEGFAIEVSTTLDIFADRDKMAAAALIVPIWTMGALTQPQEAGLLDAVRAGTGIAGFHGGMCDAFRGSLGYQFLTGGQFMAHPGGIIDYTVQIAKRDDPIVRGIPDFKIKSEQYYMHVDPGNEVLATTKIENGYECPWVKGTVMPAVWKRFWGTGKVFFASPGHVAKEFKEVPELFEIVRRGMVWAARQA